MSPNLISQLFFNSMVNLLKKVFTKRLFPLFFCEVYLFISFPSYWQKHRPCALLLRYLSLFQTVLDVIEYKSSLHHTLCTHIWFFVIIYNIAQWLKIVKYFFTSYYLIEKVTCFYEKYDTKLIFLTMCKCDVSTRYHKTQTMCRSSYSLWLCNDVTYNTIHNNRSNPKRIMSIIVLLLVYTFVYNILYDNFAELFP